MARAISDDLLARAAQRTELAARALEHAAEDLRQAGAGDRTLTSLAELVQDQGGLVSRMADDVHSRRPQADALPLGEKTSDARGETRRLSRGLDCREDPDAYRLARDDWLPSVIRYLRVDLAGGVHAGGVARRAIVERFGEVLVRDEQDVLRLLVTELVNNAVVHGGAGDEHNVVVYLAVAPERIRVEVCDRGPGLDPGALPGHSERGGNGLILVDGLASRWGASNQDGACVWFELDRYAADFPTALATPARDRFTCAPRHIWTMRLRRRGYFLTQTGQCFPRAVVETVT